MSLNAATIEVLLAKGLTGNDMLEIARAMENRADPTNAARQARHRAKKKEERNGVTVTRDKGSNERDNLTSQAEVTEASASSPRPWACPPNVNPDHWRDFRRNRRTRHLTDSETAYRGQLKALEQLADDEWPPGRLVEHAAAKGWGSINDPRVSRHGERPDHKRSNWETALAANMGSSGFS